MRRLDFIAIGAQKCATSWLYYCLKEHPELHLPSHKREVEYLGGALYRDRGTDWYFGRFAGARADQRIGEVSVEYMVDPAAATEVQRHAPDVKLVACLREPVERAISAYYWYVRKGMLPDLPLEEGLIAAANASDQNVNGPLADLIARGRYHRQLERFLDVFGTDRMLVLLYDQVRADPERALSRVFGFLGVDPHYRAASVNDRPKRNSYAPRLIRFERATRGSRIAAHVSDRMNRMVTRWRAPRLSPALDGRLRGILGPDVAHTEQLCARLAPQNRPAANLTKLWRYE